MSFLSRRSLPQALLAGSLVLSLFASFAHAANDLALQPAVVNTAPGSAYAANTRPFQGIPGIERAPKGRLWATWYGGGPDEGPENYVALVTSDDDGRTWSRERLVIDPPGPIRAFDPCLWTDPDGRLWLFWAQAHTWWDGRAGVWAISAGNPDAAQPKWTAPRRLCDGIMMNKPTALTTGEWLLPAAVWDVSTARVTDGDARRDPGRDTGTNVVVSTDRGKTWSRRGQAQIPERTFDESMFVERKNGDLWLLVRTKYGIGESVSKDRGRTWSPGQASAIPHINARFFIRRLSSGRLLLVRHHPPAGDKRRSHLTAFLSDDDGKTWQGGLLLDERAGVSYPDGVEGPNGTLYVIYDFDRKGARQILLTTFTEADVLAGKAASPGARSRIIVNQASTP
ncbi:MAG: sialidase family protein [Actinomycetota bacterium]